MEETWSLPINAAILPPRRTAEGTVYAALGTRRPGCRRCQPRADEKYKPKLSIDYAGQPRVAVGMDPFGTYAAGGMSMVFSDMLGNHTLTTGIQATSRLDEIGGTAVLHEPQAPMELGRDVRSDAIRRFAVSKPASSRRRADGLRRARDPLSCRPIVRRRGYFPIRSAARSAST